MFLSRSSPSFILSQTKLINSLIPTTSNSRGFKDFPDPPKEKSLLLQSKLQFKNSFIDLNFILSKSLDILTRIGLNQSKNNRFIQMGLQFHV